MTSERLIDRRTVLRAGALAATTPLLGACGALESLVATDVIRVAVSWSDAELAAFQDVVNGFRAEYTTEVDVIPLGDAIADAVTSQVNGKPDVVMLPKPGLIAPSLGQLQALDPGVWDPSALPARWQPLVWDNGKPYGLPFKVSNQSALWYRKDIFDDLHLSPPTTWSEWLRCNDTLLRNHITPLSVGGGDGWPLTAFFANVLCGVHPELYQQFAQPRPPIEVWGGQAFGQALRLLGGMLSVDGVLSGGVNRSLAQQYPDSIVDVFGYGNAAMVVSADFAAPVVTEFLRSPAVPAVVPFPTIDGVDPDHAGEGDDDLLVGRLPVNPAPRVIGADIAVLLAPASEQAKTFVKWLARPSTPLPWIQRHGGFIAPNSHTPPTDYQKLVRELTNPFTQQNYSFVFDLTDAMGGLGGSGALFAVLEDFLRTVGDGRTGRVPGAAQTAAAQMTAIQQSEATGGH